MARFLLALIWLLLMRAVLVAHSGVPVNIGWMLLGDIAGALVLAWLLGLVTTRAREIGLVVILGIAMYANAQHLATHGTLVRVAHLDYLADPVFVSSSALTAGALLAPVYLVLVWILCRLNRLLPRRRSLSPLIALPALVIVIAVYGAVVPTLTQPSVNLVVSIFAQVPGALLSRRDPEVADNVLPTTVTEDAVFFQRQIRGAPADDQPNILMIMVEGLSAAYLPSVAEHHDLEPGIRLPELEAQLEAFGFRTYLNVLGLQRQTNRGSYPLLCGSYPRIVTATPKMSDIAEGNARPLCLPERLRMAGYRTGYLQAAPLSFMNKARFMPAIGFERVLGAEFLQAAEAGDGWGPPDGVFFPAARDWLIELDKESPPWFATLLTVGTHHPFSEAEPAESMPPTTSDKANSEPTPFPPERLASRQAAFASMEQALGAFLQALDEDGILDSALVIITSDEAGGLLRQDTEMLPLDGNFGVLTLRPPQGMELDAFAPAEALVGSIDVPLTLVDLLGLEPPGGFIGRSLLVTGDPPRRGLMAGDTYGGAAYFILESGKLLACREALILCRSWSFAPHRLFGSLQPSQEPAFLELSARRRLVQRAAVIDIPAVSIPGDAETQ
jgi:hypothetical protein